jgi:Cft2 family RNA processing exonuclease
LTLSRGQPARIGGRVTSPDDDTHMTRFFQGDPHIRLAGTDICLDPSVPCATAVVSHGHSDHIARHDTFVATPATASFLRHRLGMHLKGWELAFGEDLELEGYIVRLIPAGHILGSAMVHVRKGGETLLYTGDFRLRPSWTAEPAEVPRVDHLIMESTYGSPDWRFPSRAEIGARLLELVAGIRARGRVPVVLAYSLGKAQEAVWWLTSNGVRVVVHPVVAAICEIYVRHGVSLGKWEVATPQGGLFTRQARDLDGAVVVIPPHMKRELEAIPRAETINLTGWALKDDWRMRADHGLPLSDHADFDELIELVELSRPSVVWVTHGSSRFARELRERGFSAEFLKRKPQMKLF